MADWSLGVSEALWFCQLPTNWWLGPPLVPFLAPVLGEGSPTKIDYRKKLVPRILTSLLEDVGRLDWWCGSSLPPIKGEEIGQTVPTCGLPLHAYGIGEGGGIFRLEISMYNSFFPPFVGIPLESNFSPVVGGRPRKTGPGLPDKSPSLESESPAAWFAGYGSDPRHLARNPPQREAGAERWAVVLGAEHRVSGRIKGRPSLLHTYTMQYVVHIYTYVYIHLLIHFF